MLAQPGWLCLGAGASALLPAGPGMHCMDVKSHRLPGAMHHLTLNRHFCRSQKPHCTSPTCHCGEQRLLGHIGWQVAPCLVCDSVAEVTVVHAGDDADRPPACHVPAKRGAGQQYLHYIALR